MNVPYLPSPPFSSFLHPFSASSSGKEIKRLNKKRVIYLGFCITAHLPLPYITILPQVRGASERQVLMFT